MHKSKLIYLLKSLDKKEFKEIDTFLKSPYFNKDKNIHQFYKLLSRDYPLFESSLLSKEKMAKRLFGASTNDSLKKLSYAMSNFSKILEKYILLKELDNQDDDKTFLYLQAYKNRRLDKLFFKKAEEFKQEINSRPYRDSSFHHILYRLNQVTFSHPATKRLDTQISSLNDYVGSFDSFFLFSKLSHYFIINNHKKVVDEEIPIFFKKEVLEKIEKPPFNADPVLQIFKYLINFQSNGFNQSVEQYYELKALVLEHRGKLNDHDHYITIALWANYAQLLYKINTKNFDREVFEVNKYIVENSLLLDGNKINSILFFNVIQMGCELNELDWVEDFIDTRAHEIAAPTREETLNISKAYLNFYRGNIDETLTYLRILQPDSFYFEIVLKGLLVRSYYLTESWDLLDNMIHSFTNYVRRHTKMSSYTKEQTLNFLRFTKKLYTNQFNNKKEYQELLEELRQYKVILYRKWFEKLLEKG